MNVPLLDLKAQYQTIRDEIKEAVEEVLDWDRRARVTAWDEVERRTASQSRGI